MLVEELLSHRTENSKTFALGNGKRQLEAHIGAIHYKDNYADIIETWKDIDLTWVDNKITKAPYELTHDGNKLTFKNKKTGEVSTIERTSVFPPGLGLEIIPELSAVRFRHTLPSDKIPFEAKFSVTGKPPITRAFDDEGEVELETSLVDGVLTEKLSQVKDKQTGKVRPAKGSIRVDPTWQVGASSDDCFRQLTVSLWDLTTTSIIAGYVSAASKQRGDGMRFTNITIPQGSTIDQAYLTLRCSNADFVGLVVRTRISAEDVDDAITFANDSAAFDTRWAARTTARVDWDEIPAWTLNVDYNSPEIKTVIQEITDRAGWVSGNDIVIFWDDFDDRSTGDVNIVRYAYSYDGSTTYAPKLVVTYTVVPVVTTQAVDNIQPTQADGHGTITATGGENAHTRGVCWNTTGAPTTADSKAEDNGVGSYGIGAFTKTMTGLSAGVTYYVRAYAINSMGIAYGNEVNFPATKTPGYIWIESTEFHYIDASGAERYVAGTLA